MATIAGVMLVTAAGALCPAAAATAADTAEVDLGQEPVVDGLAQPATPEESSAPPTQAQIAQDDEDVPPNQVNPREGGPDDRQVNPGEGRDVPDGAPAGAGSSGSGAGSTPAASPGLPRTGADVWPVAVSGLLLMLAGAALRRSRVARTSRGSTAA